VTIALAMIEALDHQLAPIDKELRAYARRQPGCKALLAHYGIEPVTAVTILAELGDTNRFSSSREAVRYAGLDITVHRPGFFQVTRPAELWHLDMTSIWVTEHGWCYLNAIIDCCTREIVGWELSLRCRAVEAIAVIDRAVSEQGIRPGMLTLGTDNGSAFTARATRLVLSGLGVRHRRGGYRDPESQAFIESWFRYLKERCVWRHEFETLEQAREVIAAYIDHYHDRPHSRLNYRTPREVRQTWDDATGALQKHAA